MKEYEYHAKGSFFAVVAGSLERHATAELAELGARVIREVPRGVEFGCDQQTLYLILYKSRLVQRVLAPLASFTCPNEKVLYAEAKSRIGWTELFSQDISFGIRSTVSGSRITHSQYAGQVVKDAVCDAFREKHGTRPDFSARGAEISFNLHVQNNAATISLDLTGASMHRRGYRKNTVAAPLQETLAAAVVKLSGWNGERVLLDPMCGSGTILAEALMAWCRIPAGYLRKDRGAEFLPDYNPGLFDLIRQKANAEIRELPSGLLFGSDGNPRNVEIARENLAQLPYGDRVSLQTSRFQALDRASGRCVITNPPYGVRLEDKAATTKLYNDLGDFLKQKCPDSEAYILCGDKSLVPELRLRAHWKKNLKNADLEVALAKIVVR